MLGEKGKCGEFRCFGIQVAMLQSAANKNQGQASAAFS